MEGGGWGGHVGVVCSLALNSMLSWTSPFIVLIFGFFAKTLRTRSSHQHPTALAGDAVAGWATLSILTQGPDIDTHR